MCVQSESICVLGTSGGQREEEATLSLRYLRPERAGNTGPLRQKQVSKQTINMWKITPCSESAVCQGLALGGKGNSTGSYLPGGKRDLLWEGTSLFHTNQCYRNSEPTGARKGWVLSQEQNEGPKCCPEHMDDGSALRGLVRKSWYRQKRGWDALPGTNENHRLLHICIENIHSGYSKPCAMHSQ